MPIKEQFQAALITATLSIGTAQSQTYEWEKYGAVVKSTDNTPTNNATTLHKDFIFSIMGIVIPKTHEHEPQVFAPKERTSDLGQIYGTPYPNAPR